MGDNIKKPDHYCEGRKYEPKDVIRDWGLNFNLGSAVKYISRAGRKGDKLEDLKKAKQFLEFEIEELEKEQKSDSGMTCKEAAEIGDAIAKGFKEGIVSSYANGILNGIGDIATVPDEYKDGVIGYIAQEVLDSRCDIDRNIPTDELRAAVIDWIIERINTGEFGAIDISADLYEKCARIRAAIANSEYRKTMDAAVKHMENTIQVTINFNDKED